MFRLGRSGYYYLENCETGVQESLRTKDKREAAKLLTAANDKRQAADLNLGLAKTYLNHADPTAASRLWDMVIKDFCTRSEIADSTRKRYEREFQRDVYDVIRQKSLATTNADDLKLVMKRGGRYTSGILNALHNHALGNRWIHWGIIEPNQWPKFQKTPRRAITAGEYQRLLAIERNDEWRCYYQMLWEIGAAQTDGALLTAENFDWNDRTLRYIRMKTGEPCNLAIGTALEKLLEKLPKSGLLFPTIAAIKDKHRSAQFCRRRRQLELTGICLHSFRYSWAERAYAAGIPERFAQAALGHSSKAVHHAYARNAYVVCPAIETPKDKVIPLVQPKQSGDTTNEQVKTG